MEQIDPQAEIDRYIAQISCEICGRHTDIVGEFTEKWFCCVKRRRAYTSKHWRKWRACFYCFNSIGNIDKWIYPSIKNVVHSYLRDLMIIQPVPVPTANVFYKDFINESNPCSEIQVFYTDNAVIALEAALRGVNMQGPAIRPSVVNV